MTFRATEDTKVIVGGQSINMSGLEEDTTVRVVTKDGNLSMVAAWQGDAYRGRFYLRSGFYKPGMERFGFRSYGSFPVELAPSFKDRLDDLLEKRFKSKDKLGRMEKEMS